MICIGIDPGQTGAVAIITDKEVNLYDTPTETVKKGKSNKTEHLPAGMASLLRGHYPCHVFIESVHSMPGQGVASMFGFGKGFGIWIGILAALEIPYTFVTPQAWKKALLPGQSDKDAARGRAMQLFPFQTPLLLRKKDIGRADALLIAEYGRRQIDWGFKAGYEAARSEVMEGAKPCQQ